MKKIYKKEKKNDSVPSYVVDDYKIGMEQYSRGEYISANELLKQIKSGV